MMWMKIAGREQRTRWVVLDFSHFSCASSFFLVGGENLGRAFFPCESFSRTQKRHKKVFDELKKHFSFLKKEKSVDFKPVESSSRTADLRMQLWPSKKHACKTANSAVLDIQAPIRGGVDGWARSSCGDERRKKEEIKLPKLRTTL